MRGAWYGSRLFWGGVLGFAFLLFVWAYKLESPIAYRAGSADVMGTLGVGEGRVWGRVDFRDPADPFAVMSTGFAVDEMEEGFFGVPKGGFAPALEMPTNVFSPRARQVVIGHWVLVAVYLLLWLGGLVLWQRRKHRLAGPVAGRIGWKRIAIPVVGMVAMAVAMIRQEEKLPFTWHYAFDGKGREIWNLLNEDGVVTAEEIIELCYRGGSHHEDRQHKAAFALLGHSDDPVPALRRMMGEAAPERRAFAALTAGNLGDARLRPDLEKLKGDGATLGAFPGDWFVDTVGDAAGKALERLDRGGIVDAVLDPKDQKRFSPWLQRAEIRE